MTIQRYQYLESGLDYIWLVNGFDISEGPQGRQVTIKNLKGLHAAIGQMLAECKKNLTGKEIRFLRNEMLMTQATLARLLEVSEQAVARWEKGKTGHVPKPAESLIRMLYREYVTSEGPQSVRGQLERIAELENAIDGHTRVTLRQPKSSGEWRLEEAP